MIVDYVALDFQPGIGLVGIRELCGHDEQMITEKGTEVAVELIDRLLVFPIKERPIRAMTMAAADRDKILTSIFMRTYGPNVQSAHRCSRCASLFDLDFSLKELAASLAGGVRNTSASYQADGTFLLPDGCRFRLPTAEDELAVIGMPPEDAAAALIIRCLLEGNSDTKGQAVQALLDEVAPIMDTDLTARCPECGAEQLVHFDIQFFLLMALYQEKSRLAWEVHRLACAYGWSLGEILGMPRSVRRTHVALVDSEFPSLRRFSV